MTFKERYHTQRREAEKFELNFQIVEAIRKHYWSLHHTPPKPGFWVRKKEELTGNQECPKYPGQMYATGDPIKAGSGASGKKRLNEFLGKLHQVAEDKDKEVSDFYSLCYDAMQHGKNFPDVMADVVCDWFATATINKNQEEVRITEDMCKALGLTKVEAAKLILQELAGKLLSNKPSFQERLDEYVREKGSIDFNTEGPKPFTKFNSTEHNFDLPRYERHDNIIINTKLYEILGVEPDATQDDIKRAYRTLARTYHPDKHPDGIDAKQRFQEISNAHDILGDEEKRRDYDAGIIDDNGNRKGHSFST